MTDRQNRRSFLKTSSQLGIGVGLGVGIGLPRRVLGANERLNIGVIGVAGRGSANLAAVAKENVVAVCDVDAIRLNGAAARFPNADKYIDYRKLLERKDLDAVVVSTPDHHHAPATIRALKRGLHVYCEKPLTHTVQEARVIAQTAAKMKVATQMGTQNHEHPGYLRLVELLRSGAIGPVREAHVITDRPGRFWKQGPAAMLEHKGVQAALRGGSPPTAPSTLDWDLWLGPAENRPYDRVYAPFKWRGWWDFGCGAIGDMAIHLMDPAFWALELGGPVKVTADGPKPLPDCGPTWMHVLFEFGQRGDLPPCKLHWYEGTAKPPQEVAQLLPMNGSLFIGDDGKIAIQHGQNPVLLPAEKFAGFKGPDPFLPKSPGHHQQWIAACKTGSRTGSNFQYAGPFTEIVLLGNVAFRTGKPIRFDPATMKVTDVPEANQYLSKPYRKGWEV